MNHPDWHHTFATLMTEYGAKMKGEPEYVIRRHAMAELRRLQQDPSQMGY